MPKYFNRLPLLLCALVALTVGVLSSANAATPAVATDTVVPPGLVLWNKLGSEDEITHSAYGPNLVMSDCALFGCGLDVPGMLGRSEERRVGKEGCSRVEPRACTH